MICAYLITKNESSQIRTWFEHMKSCDMIYITDTGSEDDTVDIIKEYQLKNDYPTIIYDQFIQDGIFDFSKARNHALNAARNQIIIYENSDDPEILNKWLFICVDTDEWLDEGSIYIIRKNHDSGQYVGDFYLSILSYFNENGEIKEQYGLHKGHSFFGWNWQRVVHERLYTDAKEYHPYYVDGAKYFHNCDTSKPRDYYTLLKYDNEIRPRDPLTLSYLCWEAIKIPEWENYKKYALGGLEALLDNTNENSREEPFEKYELVQLFYFNLATYSKEVKQNDEKEFYYYSQAYDYMINQTEFPNFRRTAFNAMRSALKIGKLQFAIDAFRTCIECTTMPFSWFDDIEIYNNKELVDTMNHYIENSYQDNTELQNTMGILYAGLNWYYNGENYVDHDRFARLNQRFYNEYKNIADNLCTKYENEVMNSMEVKENLKPDPSKNKISVYAICKNEEQYVDKWYESMKEADEIVVLDTGSTDRTVEFLKKYPKIKVFQKTYNPWRFDTPRNDAMALTDPSCNILLSTDLDELLEPGWAQPIREKWIDGVTERGDYQYVWSHLPNGKPGRVFGYNKLHSRNWIWKYPVHELLWNINTHTEMYDVSQSIDLWDEMILHHYPSPKSSRSNYLPLLELRREENSEDTYGLIYLMHEYYYNGYYQKSIDLCEELIDPEKYNITGLELASCYTFMGNNYENLKNIPDAIYWYNKSINYDPTYLEPYLDIARVYIGVDNHDIAIGYVKQGLKKAFRHYTWLERDTSWSYEPYDLLSLACYYAGYKDESLKYAVIAASYFPEDERLQNNIKLITEAIQKEKFK